MLRKTNNVDTTQKSLLNNPLICFDSFLNRFQRQINYNTYKLIPVIHLHILMETLILKNNSNDNLIVFKFYRTKFFKKPNKFLYHNKKEAHSNEDSPCRRNYVLLI